MARGKNRSLTPCIPVRLRVEDYEELNKISKDTEKPVSVLIRQAVTAFILNK